MYDCLEVVGLRKQIHGLHGVDAVVLLEPFQVARQRCRVARNINETWDGEGDECVEDFSGAAARRIEDGDIEVALLGGKTSHGIARRGGNDLDVRQAEGLGVAAAIFGGQARLLDGGDFFDATGDRQRQVTNAGVEVENDIFLSEGSQLEHGIDQRHVAAVGDLRERPGPGDERQIGDGANDDALVAPDAAPGAAVQDDATDIKRSAFERQPLAHAVAVVGHELAFDLADKHDSLGTAARHDFNAMHEAGDTAEQATRRRNGGIDLRCGEEAVIDRHQGVAAAGNETDVAVFRAQGEAVTVAKLLGGADAGAHRRFGNPGMPRQMIAQIVLFGAQLRVVLDVLPRAAAAERQKPARWLSALGARFDDAFGVREGEGATVLAYDDVDVLARYDTPDEDNLAVETPDAVWPVTEIIDVDSLRHAAWLSLQSRWCNHGRRLPREQAWTTHVAETRRNAMSERPSGLMPSAGWAVLHLYYRIDRSRWRLLADRPAAVEEFTTWLRKVCAEEGLQLMLLAGVTKSDFGLIAVHADLWRIQQLTQEVAATAFGSCLQQVYEFLSLSEASEYITNELDWSRSLIEEQKLDPASPEFSQRIGQLRKRTAMYSGARLHPQLPDASYPMVCFYPMAKSRRDIDNWYRLDFDTRKKLMLQHGNSGRRFADRVTQLITTCTGIDDWEWGVTLFSKDPKAIRDIVYELRYDEASARYGMFGSFYISLRFEPDQLPQVLHI